MNYTQQIARTTEYRVSVIGGCVSGGDEDHHIWRRCGNSHRVRRRRTGIERIPGGESYAPRDHHKHGSDRRDQDGGLWSSALGPTETRSYYLPVGASISDTLSYDLTAGNYQVSAAFSQPGASAQASFSVLKENVVTMTTVPGEPGMDGLIPVTMTLTNSGYNEINGAVQLAVVNNDGKTFGAARRRFPASGHELRRVFRSTSILRAWPMAFTR